MVNIVSKNVADEDEVTSTGERYLSTNIAREVIEILLNDDVEKNDLMSVLPTCEREVLEHIEEDNSNAAIADKLSLIVRTVESHRANIMTKMCFNS